MAKNFNGRHYSSSGRQLNNQKQTDLYNTGMPGDNPFQTMYQATMGRAQTASGQRTTSQTPALKSSKAANMAGQSRFANSASKSQAKMSMTAKREQNRRFGEYHGEDGIEVNGPNQAIWDSSPCKLTCASDKSRTQSLTSFSFSCNSPSLADWVLGFSTDPLH